MIEKLLDSVLFWNVLSYIVLFIAICLIIYVIKEIFIETKNYFIKKNMKNLKNKK